MPHMSVLPGLRVQSRVTTSVVQSLLRQLQIILQVIESNCMVVLNWLEGDAYNSGRLVPRYALLSLFTAQHQKLSNSSGTELGEPNMLQQTKVHVLSLVQKMTQLWQKDCNVTGGDGGASDCCRWAHL